MAVTRNIIIWRGEDVPLNFTLSPVQDITDWTIEFTVKRSYQSVLATFQVEANIPTGPDGYFEFVLPSDFTDIAAGNYVYDVTRTDVDAKTELFFGQFIVKPTVNPL